MSSTTGTYGESVRRPLTTVFIDLVGSTPLSILLDGEEYAQVIDDYRRLCQRLVIDHRGFVAADEGDGRFVWFGWPTARHDDAERAVAMSVNLMNEIEALSKSVVASVGRPLQVRIGMHTGTTIVASGIEPGFADVRGATVNLAAKVQAEAAPGEIVISEATASALTQPWQLEPAGSLSIAELTGGVALFKVTGRDVDGNKTRSGVQAPGDGFVNRHDELRRLIDPENRFVVVIGPPGVGKTALLERGAAQFPARSQLTIHGAESQQESPLAPLADALEEAGALTDPSVLKGPDAADLVVEMIEALCAAGPLRLAVEDIQWIDHSSLEVIDRVVMSGNDRLSVWAAGRSEPDLACLESFENIHLKPLGRDDATLLISTTTPGLNSEAAEAVLRRADGNPFFITWLARAAQDDFGGVRQVLKPRSGMPIYVQQALRAEIDNTGISEDLTSTAAAIGVEFSEHLLSATLDRPLLQIRRDLDLLASRGLIHLSSPGSHRFSHALIRDLAYDLMLTPERTRRHGAVAETMERLGSGDNAVIGFHFDRAGNAAKAVEHQLIAARRCRHTNAYHEAATLAARAIELATEPTNSVPVDLAVAARELAASLATTLQNDQSVASREELQDLLDPRTEARWREMSRVREWARAISDGDLTRSAVLLYATYRAARQDFPSIKVLNTNARGIAMTYRGRFAHAERLLEGSLDEMRSNGVDPWLAEHWGTLDDPVTMAYSYAWPVFDLRGRRLTANRAIAEAWERAWALPGGATTIAHLASNAALYWQRLGDAARSTEAADTIVNTGQELGLEFWDQRGQAMRIVASTIADPTPESVQRLIEHGQEVSTTYPTRGAHFMHVAAGLADRIEQPALLGMAVAAATEVSDQTGAHHLDADLMRLGAHHLELIGASGDEVIDKLMAAATTARRQGARRYELRALSELARRRPEMKLGTSTAIRRLSTALDEFPEPGGDRDYTEALSALEG